jgi:hypothetical protein
MVGGVPGDDDQPRRGETGREPSREVTAWAQAYTGSLHGHRWPVGADAPAAAVTLVLDGVGHRYRLVRQPGTTRAARDRSGNYVYVPVGPLPRPEPGPAANREGS